ncbi:MAG: hypothetical protein ACI395_10685 [Candidatus Cryptobacteroides sp.]
MKNYRILAAILVLAALTGCDKQKLPYDLDGVEKGVVINIHKPEGAGAAMSTDKSDVFSIILDIPEQQGDWSMLKEAYLTAVYTHNGEKTSAAVTDGFKEFPCTLQVSLSDVCTKLGVSTLSVGDRIEFTPSYVLNSGTEVKGWTSLGGFNNTAFTGWKMADGSSFSYRISYTAFAPFIKEHYIGTGTLNDGYDTPVTITEISELPDAEWIPAGVPADKLVGLKLEGDIWFGGDVIKMWINTLDFTLIIPDQVIAPNWTYPYASLGTYDGKIAYCEGEIDTLNETINFYLYSLWGPYTLGDGDLIIYDIK